MLFIRLFLSVRKIDIGSGCYIKNVTFSGKASIENNCRIVGSPKIKLGSNFYANVGCHFMGDIEIGDNVMIGPQTIIWSRDHGTNLNTNMNQQGYITKKIIIQNNVWIGANVTVLKGVVISDGCVIAAGSVLTKSTEPNGIYGGNPAKLLKFR